MSKLKLFFFLKKNKMDTVDNAIKLAQQVDSQALSSNSGGGGTNTPNQPPSSTLYEDLSFDTFLSTPNSSSSLNGNNSNNNNNNNKYANLLKLYEYQIVEMQHEYELLLEDKVRYLEKCVSHPLFTPFFRGLFVQFFYLLDRI